MTTNRTSPEDRIMSVVEAQTHDPKVKFRATTVTEANLQQEIHRLHFTIRREYNRPHDCANHQAYIPAGQHERKIRRGVKR